MMERRRPLMRELVVRLYQAPLLPGVTSASEGAGGSPDGLIPILIFEVIQWTGRSNIPLPGPELGTPAGAGTPLLS